MITFKQHIEITKYVQRDKNVSGYLDTLEPADRIKAIRDIALVYPLGKNKEISEKTLKNFKCYTKIEDLVLGQFIMIEQIITGKVNYSSSSENDLELAKLIMRPIFHEVFDNENIEDEKKNEEKIMSTDVIEVYSVLQNFLDNREYALFTQFKGVFYELPEEDETDSETERETKTGEALFQQQWYWYSIVRMLAKEDITKYDEIYMLKMSLVMPEMSFLAQKNKIDAARQREYQALNKL